MNDLEKYKFSLIEKFERKGVKYCVMCLNTNNLILLDNKLLCDDCLYINKILNKTKNIN